MSTGCLGARVVEADVAQLERAAAGELGDRRRRRSTTDDGGVEHLLDALGAHRGAGHHHRHERGHHHRHQDLHEVAEEGDQRADLHVAAVDAVGAEPEHGDARHVEHQHHDREHERHAAGRRAATVVGEVVVGVAEALAPRRARARTPARPGCR